MTNLRPTIQNFWQKYIFIIVIVFICKLSHSQDLPISYCLSNCKSCNPQSPFQCISTQSNGQTDCIPLYVGPFCSQSSGYNNIITESGGINNPFVNWSQIIEQNCSVVFGNNKTVLSNEPIENSLGPLNSTSPPLVKIFTLPNRTINQIVMKFTLALKGDNLTNSSVVSQTNTNENGSTVITTTTTQQVINGITIANYPFLTLDIVNAVNQQNVHSAVMTYAQLSPVETTCGYIYQYQIIFNVSENFTTLRASISYIGPDASTWNLLDFRINYGCGAFMVENGCSNCLNGFYPVRQPFKNLIIECGVCPPNCKTCSSNTSCLVCQPLAKLNQTTNLCQNQNPTYKTKDLKVLEGSNKPILSQIAGPQAITSQNGIIVFQTDFPQNQPVLVKFLLLFSKQYLNNNPSLVINYSNPLSAQADQYRIDIQSIEKYGGIYIPQLSNTSKLYFKTIIINQNFTGFRGNSLRLKIQSNYKSSAPNESLASKQFFLVKYQAIQYQCSQRCAECSVATTSVCLRCDGFFDRTSSCQRCANGFYLKKAIISNGSLIGKDQCIKCHSTCKQCLNQARDDCTQCFSNFQLNKLKYNYQCVSCVFAQYNSPNEYSKKCSQNCIKNYPLNSVIGNINCSRCLSETNFENFEQNIACRNCWIRNNLAGSRCQPSPAIGYSLYGTDAQGGIINLDSWSGGLSFFNCSPVYPNLYGVLPTNSTSVIQRTELSLPPHQGLTIFFNIFKIGNWVSDSLSINVTTTSAGRASATRTVNFNNSAGTDLCFGQGNEMIFTYIQQLPNHITTGPFVVRVTGSKGGLFIRQIVIYLGNCASCEANNLNFAIEYLPKYYLQNNQESGLKVWLKFNYPVTLLDNQNMDIQKSFNFSIDKLGLENLLPYTDTQNLLSQRQQLYYFLPLNRSFLNGTLFGNTTQGSRIIKQQNILAKRLLIVDRLELDQSSTIVQRYDNIDEDYLFSFRQVCQFFAGVTWFALYAMIVAAFFGIGVIMEQFSILLQLLFIHIYISSSILAASFKTPLACMEKIQNLNFFAYPHATGIEQGWIGDNKINSPHVFQQYNIDIYFLRSFYPIIIINMIYLAWFLLMYFLEYLWDYLRPQQNIFLRFFRNIARRPVNYADQIWRYQFITTIWSASIYFHDFSNNTGFKRVNIALTICAFVISLIWPIFVMIYTYIRSRRINSKHFLYQYEDIFYKKTPSTLPELKYFLYIAIRFGRYFIFAIVIAQSIKIQFVAPTVLLISTIIELVYILYLKIYLNKFYLALKVIQGLLFIAVEILIMIMQQFSDAITTDAYFSLGFALTTIYIIMIANGLIRIIFLAYKKGKDFWTNRYSYGDQGENKNYDNVKPSPIKQYQVQQ